jgi:hypothetical protein
LVLQKYQASPLFRVSMGLVLCLKCTYFMSGITWYFLEETFPDIHTRFPSQVFDGIYLPHLKLCNTVELFSVPYKIMIQESRNQGCYVSQSTPAPGKYLALNKQTDKLKFL